MPERFDGRAALDEEPGDMPAAVADGVVEWGADRSARGLQVGAAVDEDDGDVHVVGARRPVQRRLGAVTAGVVVGVGPGVEEQRDRGRSGGKVAGPIGGGVQRSSPASLHAFAPDHANRRQLGSLDHQGPQSVQIAAVDRPGQLDGDGVAARQGQPGRRLARWVGRHRGQVYDVANATFAAASGHATE